MSGTFESLKGISLREIIYNLKHKPRYRRRFIRKILLGVLSLPLIAVILYVLLFILVWIGVFGKLPRKKELAVFENQVSTEIYAAGGELLGKYFIYDRTQVKLDQISPNVIHCLLVTEDVRFYQHRGIDYRSLGRVMFKTILLGQSSAGGGSTISQQLAKNIYPRRNNGIFSLPVSKTREMLIARRLEKIFSKDEILLMYLNTVPFGENVFGISAASLRFFNKNPLDLNIQEAAVLIGMLKATTYYNPRHHAQRAAERRNIVIGQLNKYDYLSKEEADSIMQLPVKINYNPITHNQGPAQYFRENLRLECDRIIQDYNSKNLTGYNLYTDGLKIYTTIDYNLQLIAESVVKKQMSGLQKTMDAYYKNIKPDRARPLLNILMQNSARYRSLQKLKISEQEIERIFNEKINMELFFWDQPELVKISPMDSIFKSQQILHSGLVSINPSNGHIKAWVGGNDFRFFQFDNVLTKRQAGSAFKPFLYATAIESGIDPCKYVSNEIRVYEEYDDWAPTNASGNHEGYYSMKGALAFSVNTVSANYIMDTGIMPVIETAHKAGIKSNLPAVPSLALGTADVSLLEMTSSYGAFINNGIAITPRWLLKIEDNDGNVIYENKQINTETRAFSESTALLMQDMLKAVVDSGTAESLKYRFGLYNDLAGKTGTTQNNADTWFVGFSPDLITGVWTGIENPAFARLYHTPLGSGASAVPLWGEFTRQAASNGKTRKYFSGSFQPLPDSLAYKVDCLLYRDELPLLDNWIERLFGVPQDRKDRRERDRPNRLRRFLEDLFRN